MTRRPHAWLLVLVALIAASCGRDGGSEEAAATTNQTTLGSAESSTTSTSVEGQTTTSMSRVIDAEPYPLPAYDPSRGVPSAKWLNLTIIGDVSSRCVWIVNPDGTRIAAVWPPGTTARFDPVRIYNADGAQIWAEGERRNGGGGTSGPGADVNKVPPEACRTGDSVFLVGSVD